MGLFKKKSTDPSEIEQLKSEIAAMAARLDATDADKRQLGVQVEHLATRLNPSTEPPPAPPPPEPTVHPDEFKAIVHRVTELTTQLDAERERAEDRAPAVDPEAFDSVNEEVRSISERVDQIADVDAEVRAITDRLDQLDARITSISNELANQITELSSDIEGLSAGEPAAEAVDQLRDTQIKLANEQARYQIAFREDLAHLADFLKHH